MQSINKINSTSIQVKSRSGNVLQLFLFAEKRLEFSLVRTRYKKQNFAPHFFARFSGKKITKTQVFTSRGEAALHSKAAGFSSHLHEKRSDLLVKTFHSADASLHL